jgi:hypothetical protein
MQVVAGRLRPSWRLRSLADLAVVVTDRTHDAGFRERIEQELPGIEEIRPSAELYAPRRRR